MPKPLKILQASAGSGKTFSLTVHYLVLLFSCENKYREILAVTFTNMATEEMKTRILEVLRGLAEGDQSNKINDYRTLVLKAHADLSPQTLKQQADNIYRKILHDYSRFSVSTIDGFVQKVIRGFAFELGLDAGYGLEMNYDKVKNALADKLDKALDEQPQLLQWIINLAKDRINNNVSWNYRRELLDLTGEIFKERYQPFEKAMENLSLIADMDQVFSDYQLLTRQSIEVFETAIKECAKDALDIFQVLDIDTGILKGKSRSPLLNLKKILDGDFNKIQSLYKLIDQPEEWLQKGKDSSLYEEMNPCLKKLIDFYQDGHAAYILAQGFNKNLYYLRLMQEMAGLLKSYRDESPNLLISDAQNILKGITDDAGDNPSFIWEKMGSFYRNFLFDEFQDTSANQWGSFKSLLSNAMAAPSEKFIDHLIVGDTKQSIYRWRNGDWNILHQQAKLDLGEHHIMDDSLEENYRSTENIIQFNNQLFKALPQLLQLQLNQTIGGLEVNNDVLPWWKNQGFDHIVSDVYAGATQKITPKTLKGGTIKCMVLKNEEGEPKYTFTELAIAKMLEEVKALLEVKKYQRKDICILVRKNAEAIAAVKALLENGISVISGEALLVGNNSAVKLILNTLQILAGLAENTALYKANAISLYSRLQGSVVETQHYFGLKFKKLAQLTAVLPHDLCLNWQSWMQQPLPELMEKIMEAYGLNYHKEHLPYLFAIRDFAGNFSRQGEKGITAFLRFWEEEGIRKTLPSSENADAVQVVTIHKSKGLAFRAVIVPFCNWDINGKTNSIFWVPAADTPYHHLQSIPLKYNKELGNSTVAKHYFEELLFNNMDALNMLYVATTRSKEYLFLSAPWKKADTLTNIGDLLIRALGEEIDIVDGYVIDEPVVEQPSSIEKDTFIELENYPVSNRLTKIFDAGLKNANLDLLIGNDAGRSGSILHEVLANASQSTEIDGVLNKMLADGLFKEVELPGFKTRASAVLENPDLQSVLGSSKYSLTEQTIIDTHGKSYRPDKVLITDEGVTIIDYKFTLEESNKHIEQVDHYKSLLLAMGYAQVKTYLFYAVTGKLKLV
ncbi:ATP-dependent helicase/nuclease subunit A [Pedobacter sp. CG_S7]|uniref:UvrD-helicase domain-containing protein n=1 Tax=Pedobacter sp. CG_S7 TaxID=3143930 RepID=UPI003391180E